MVYFYGEAGWGNSLKRAFNMIWMDDKSAAKVKDYRIVDNTDRFLNNYRNSNTTYLFIESVFDTYIDDDAGYLEVDNLIINGENVLIRLTEPITRVKAKPQDVDDIDTLVDDEGYIVAQKKHNIIAFSVDPEKLTEKGLRVVLTALGFDMMDEQEYFNEQLRKMVAFINKTEIEKLERRVRDNKRKLQTLELQHRDIYGRLVEDQIKLEGAGTIVGKMQSRFNTQLERLFKSKYLESIEIIDQQLVLTTVPIEIGLWNIGQYELKYMIGCIEPKFRRLTMPTNSDVWMGVSGMTITDCGRDHMHISAGDACTGNSRELFEKFWEQDFLTGFNYAIQYLKSYSKRGGPFITFANYLYTLGYKSDAKKIIEHGDIHLIDNGVMYQNDPDGFIIDSTYDEYEDKYKKGTFREITVEELREWGCTGEFDELDERSSVDDWFKNEKGEEQLEALGMTFRQATGTYYDEMSMIFSLEDGEEQ